MATVAGIRAGLAANLEDVARELGVQVSPYMLASPTPPALHLWPAEVNYHESMQDGHDTWTFRIQALIALSSDQGAQMKLDELLAPTGASSVREALESDPQLGGHAYDVIVTGCTGYQVYVTDTGAVLGAEWSVDVSVAAT